MVLDAGQKYIEAQIELDPRRRVSLLAEAEALLRRLLADYPDSAEARQLRSGESVAGVSLRDLQIMAGDASPAPKGLTGLSRAERRQCLDTPSAVCLFQLAVHAAKDLSNLEERHRMLADIALAQARGADVEAALWLARAIPSAGPEGDGFRAVAEIAVAQARAGERDAALEAAADLASSGLKDRVRLAVLENALENGSLEESAAQIEEMEDLPSLARAHAALAQAEFRVGDEAAGERSFAKAFQLAEDLAEHAERDAVLLDLVASMAAVGRPAEAMRCLEAIVGPGFKARAVASLARSIAASGDVAEALKLTDSLPGGGARAELIGDLAEERVAAAAFEDAVAMIGQLKPPLVPSPVFSALALRPHSVAEGKRLHAAAAELADAADRAWARAIAARVLVTAGETESGQPMAEAVRGDLEAIEAWDALPAELELAAVQVALGDATGAAEALRALPDGAVWYEGVEALAGAIAVEPDRATAETVMNAFEEPLDRAKFGVVLARRLAETGALPEAVAVAAAIDRPRERDFAFFEVAKVQLARGDVVKARATIARARSLQADGFLLRDFALAQVSAGDLRHAAATISGQSDLAERARGFAAIAEAAAQR